MNKWPAYFIFVMRMFAAFSFLIFSLIFLLVEDVRSLFLGFIFLIIFVKQIKSNNSPKQIFLDLKRDINDLDLNYLSRSCRRYVNTRYYISINKTLTPEKSKNLYVAKNKNKRIVKKLIINNS